MPKVLMIGAGIGQVYLCSIIKKRGLKLIVVTIPGNYPCISLADKVYYVDIFDKQKVLEVAVLEKIDIVISDQNDLMMPTVAYIAETLNLPGNTVSQINAYCNKNIFRDNCQTLSIPSPKHTKTQTIKIPESFKNIPFPWVVKPEDSQSSIGVSKVNNIDEYTDAVIVALNASRNKSAIIEEFFIGKEIVAEGFIYKGIYYNLGFADRIYFDTIEYFIPSQTIFPSNISIELQKQIIAYETRMARYIKPDFAIVHSEYLINEDTNRICIVESALRGGGVYISSHLIPEYTGININELLLDCCMGKKIDISIFERKINQRNASAYICFYLPQGIVQSIIGVEHISRLQYVIKCDINISIGDKTQEITTKGQRLGPIIIKGNNRIDIERKISYVQSLLDIKVVDCNGNVYGPVWC